METLIVSPDVIIFKLGNHVIYLCDAATLIMKCPDNLDDGLQALTGGS